MEEQQEQNSKKSKRKDKGHKDKGSMGAKDKESSNSTGEEDKPKMNGIHSTSINNNNHPHKKKNTQTQGVKEQQCNGGGQDEPPLNELHEVDNRLNIEIKNGPLTPLSNSPTSPHGITANPNENGKIQPPCSGSSQSDKNSLISECCPVFTKKAKVKVNSVLTGDENSSVVDISQEESSNCCSSSSNSPVIQEHNCGTCASSDKEDSSSVCVLSEQVSKQLELTECSSQVATNTETLNNCGGGEIDPEFGICYMSYESEIQMPSIMKLIQKDLSEPYSVYTYRYFIHNWPKLCFLAMDGDHMVGAIVCKLDVHKQINKRGYIAMLAVDENYRRKKIGSNLVLKSIRAMAAEDADEIVLETEITNKSALRLYENLGFVRDKRLFRYYLNGVDALRLKLWLK